MWTSVSPWNQVLALEELFDRRATNVVFMGRAKQTLNNRPSCVDGYCSPTLSNRPSCFRGHCVLIACQAESQS